MIKLLPWLCATLFSILFSSTVNSSTLLIIGDSLSAGYQIPVAQNWPSLLAQQQPLKDKQIEVINASISGDTSGNGRARLNQLLTQHQPDYVLIELGANDGLRGFAPTVVHQNLTQMIQRTKQHNAVPLLMQIRVPSNYGKRYSQAFAQVYSTISEEQEVALLPFYLEHVINKPEWMNSDGLHPNQKAQPWIAQFMATQLSKVLR